MILTRVPERAYTDAELDAAIAEHHRSGPVP